ncbi:DUF7504 family protein [Halosimplex pelagicum]|uniref:DUF7504 family protein n=1 Tax=Halosimplex pelagicum TaxID=869886 RepID=UPI001FE9512A|nr:hypothetical protein [Halosimplex pelagicum]
MSSQATSLTSGVDAASNILLLSPSLDSHDDEACLDLLTVTDPTEENVLSVTFTQSATDRIDLWDAHVDERPARAGIISVGEITRSASADTTSTQRPVGPLTIETVSDPDDLTDLGITLNTFLSEWGDDDNQTVACFHSLTPLLQYADLQRVFRFLHVLTGRLETSDAVAHYHMDPNAHDQQTISTLRPLFDAIVDLDEDSEWNIQ